MGNHGVCNNNIVLELSLNSSMVQHNSTNTTKKPCSQNFDPSLTLALPHDHSIIKKKPVCDLGGLYRQDSVSGGGGGSSLISVASVCVKRKKEVKSEESGRVISTVISEVGEDDDDDDDDDDNSVNGRKKLRLTKAQSALLEEAFKHHSALNPHKQKQELARELKLRPRQVEVWFQNRRARTKLKQTEVDCEYLKKCCEALKEENTTLHKELQELKALKVKQSTQPPYCSCRRPPSPCVRHANASETPLPQPIPTLLPLLQNHNSLIHSAIHLQPVNY